jgi:hypothetical protein
LTGRPADERTHGGHGATTPADTAQIWVQDVAGVQKFYIKFANGVHSGIATAERHSGGIHDTATEIRATARPNWKRELTDAIVEQAQLQLSAAFRQRQLSPRCGRWC